MSQTARRSFQARDFTRPTVIKEENKVLKLFELQPTIKGQRNFKVLGWQFRFSVEHQFDCGYGTVSVSFWKYCNYCKILQRFTFMALGFNRGWFFSVGKN